MSAKQNAKTGEAIPAVKTWIAAAAVFIITFILYSGTFDHGYVLDDHAAVKDNEIIHRGIAAIPEIFSSPYRDEPSGHGDVFYRPVTSALFAVEWELWPAKSGAAHVVNVFLYGLACVLLLKVLLTFTRSFVFSALTAAFFTVHPVHTEVVANIKSADEILAFIFFLAALLAARRYVTADRKMMLVATGLFFLLSLLSKESAVTFLPVVLFTVHFFLDARKKKLLRLTAVLCVSFAVYVLMRLNAGAMLTGGAADTNYLAAIPDLLTRTATAVMILGYYILILLFPYRLMSDASFAEFGIVPFTSWQFLLPAAVILLSLWYAIKKVKERNTAAYGIVYFLITVSLASNIFFLTGTNYGERLLFSPSLGISIILAHVLTASFRNKNNFSKPLILVTGIIVFCYGFRTLARVPDWKDGLTLFAKDAETASRSGRAHYYLGNQYLIMIEQSADPVKSVDYIQKARKELKLAVSIDSSLHEAYYSLGLLYSMAGMPDSSLSAYSAAVGLFPDNARFRNNYGDMLFRTGRYDDALREFREAVALRPDYTDAILNLGTAFARKGQEWLEQARDAQLRGDERQMMTSYNVSMNYYDSAATRLRQAAEARPDFYLPYSTLGVVYRNRGQPDSALYYESIAARLGGAEQQ